MQRVDWLHLLRLVVLGAMLGSLAPTLCLAQEDERRARTERPSDGAMAEKLKRFYDAYAAERYDDARKCGAELLRMRLSPFEVGNVERVLAARALREERWSDAREHLQRALASGGLDDRIADDARHQIVLLLLREELWRDAIDAWNARAAAASARPTAEAYHELALAYFGLEDFERALEPARKAVELALRPSERALQLLIAIHFKREAYDQVAPLLKTLIGIAPAKRERWVQLAGVQVQLGNVAEAAQSMQIAYYGGLLTDERDILSLCQLLVQIGIPYRAARILSTAVENRSLTPDAKLYRFLGEAWVAAQELARAIEPLRTAARLADDGNLYVRVAELHARLEDWSGTIEALRLARDKGRIADPCRAELLLGIALYRDGRPAAARRWLEQTLACPGSPGKPWLQLLDDETASLAR